MTTHSLCLFFYSQLPKPKPMTKWQAFANAKGIAPKAQKDRMVFDEQSQEWVPRWGYKGKNKQLEDQWIVEVPANAGECSAASNHAAIFSAYTSYLLHQTLSSTQSRTRRTSVPLVRTRTKPSDSRICNAQLSPPLHNNKTRRVDCQSGNSASVQSSASSKSPSKPRPAWASLTLNFVASRRGRKVSNAR